MTAWALIEKHTLIDRHGFTDPKLVADQLGHTLDVNQNVLNVAGSRLRRDAVNLLENTLQTAIGVFWSTENMSAKLS